MGLKLTGARDEFVRSRKSQDYAAGTITNNRRHINKLIATTGDIDCRKITPRHIDQMLAGQSRVNGSGSLGNMQATLSAFFRWCRSRGYMKPDQDPLAERRAPKHEPKPRLIIPPHKFPALLDAAGRTHPRDRAVIALGIYTMARQSEIANLKIDNLDLDAGELLMFQSKTRTFDVMPVSAELDSEMRRWLTWYTRKHGNLDPDWYLVPARKKGQVRAGTKFIGNPDAALSPTRRVANMHDIAKKAILGVSERLTDDTGTPTREGMHTLRRSAARALFDELQTVGYDGAARQAQTWLHHASMTQTERYLQITPDRDSRNRRFRGKPLYPSLQDSTVVQLTEYREAHGD